MPKAGIVSVAGKKMKYGLMLVLFALLLFPPGVRAQTGKQAGANDTISSGRRLFQQHCGVCHTQPTLTNPMYGPSLYRDTVNGKEDAVSDFIGKGSGRMPGFRYGLRPSEIGAIVEYLKTVPKPAQRSIETKGEGPVD
jgi:mono/diheme cytochrome c family protein